MSVDRHEVERIARLAHLRLGADEVAGLTDDLNRILEYAERLHVDRVDADPAADPELRRSDREDASVQGVRDRSLVEPDPLVRRPDGFAPDWRDDFFVVPPPPGVSGE